MPKAKIITQSGITVHMDGTPAEIAAAVQEIKRQEEKVAAPKRKSGKPGPATLVDLIGSLIHAGFFRKPRDLATVKGALEEMGHRYPVTTLSGAMLEQVRKQNLRRTRKDKLWVYYGVRR